MRISAERARRSRIVTLRSRIVVCVAWALTVLFSGCGDEMASVREVQQKRQQELQQQSVQDHLGETMVLLDQFVDLNEEKAARQVVFHLNQWSEQQAALSGTAAKEANRGSEFQLPSVLKSLQGVVASERLADEITREQFQPRDVRLLRDAYLFRRIASWVEKPERDDPILKDWWDEVQKSIGEESTEKLRAAARLFDWTVRNVALEPPVATPQGVPVPDLSLGMTFEGPGYRQTDFQTVWRGRGDWMQRAGVFTQLCFQANLDAAVLAAVDTQTGKEQPWCIGVFIDDSVYLFEPQLGLPVPGPDQTGIATLAEARRDDSVMRRLNVLGFYDYPLSKSDIAQNIALLNASVEQLAPRMRRLEESLTGQRRLTLAIDAERLVRRWDEQPGIFDVRLWGVPFLAELYAAELQRFAARNPSFGFWYLLRWAILEGETPSARELALGRWAHLTGQFGDMEESGKKGARTLYLQQRPPEFDIEDLRIDVDLQAQYGVRRGLGMSTEEFESRLQQVQSLMRLGKRTATYWLSLVQYDDGRFKTAANWFGKRVLNEEQASFWNDAANYNLARSLEKQGQIDEAVELLKSDRPISGHGDRLRARLLEKHLKSDEASE